MSPVALVTGAGSGIGRASSIALAVAGFTVVCSGRRAENIGETASVAGNGAIAIGCDGHRHDEQDENDRCRPGRWVHLA